MNLLLRGPKGGLGKAYIAGFKWGIEKGYEAMIEMDADFSHRPEDLIKILNINTDKEAMKIANYYGVTVKNPYELFTSMPWDKIAQEYDGIHHTPMRRELFMGSWDVESTAWLNTNMLQNQGQVPVAQKFMSKVISKLRR